MVTVFAALPGSRDLVYLYGFAPASIDRFRRFYINRIAVLDPPLPPGVDAGKRSD